MKKLFTLVFCIILFSNISAQQKIDTSFKNYDVVISFNSICCGAPSAEFLRDFLNQYSNKNKITPQAWLLGGCGREGEFKILLSLAKLKASKKIKFNKAIKELIPTQNNKNKTVKPSSGNINITYNPSENDFSNCTGKITEWKYCKE